MKTTLRWAQLRNEARIDTANCFSGSRYLQLFLSPGSTPLHQSLKNNTIFLNRLDYHNPVRTLKVKEIHEWEFCITVIQNDLVCVSAANRKENDSCRADLRMLESISTNLS